MQDLHDFILMQYQTPLEDSFAVAGLRQRVAEVAPVFDQMPGLLFKLYGLNEGPAVPFQEYSSIYLWESAAPMYRFLSGPWFENYAQTFGRPAVRTYTLHSLEGAIRDVVHARFAVRSLLPLPRKSRIETTLQAWQARRPAPGALVRVTGFDPAVWEFIDITAWADQPPGGDLDHVYALARVSMNSNELQ
ncbi:MAG TPA: DUF4865 family protein [Chthoniobacterales bacterium]